MKKAQPILGLITDTHIDRNNYELQVSIFKQFRTLLREMGIETAIHMGDWFKDRSAQDVARLSIVRSIIDSFQAAGITLRTFAGNHDKQDLTSPLSFLTPYDSVSDTSFHLYAEYTWVDFNKTMRLHFIPYFLEGECFDEQLARTEYGNGKNLLFSHIGVNGARNNDGSLVEDGVIPDAFAQFDEVFLGHYHDPATIGNNVHYIGSSHQANYGENEYKGFTIVYDDGTFEQYQSNFQKYKKFKVKIDELKKFDLGALSLNDYNRLILQGSYNQIQTVDVSNIRKLGVDVRFENTVETNYDIDKVESDEVVVFDKKMVQRAFLEYINQAGHTPRQKAEGLKLLKYY